MPLQSCSARALEATAGPRKPPRTAAVATQAHAARALHMRGRFLNDLCICIHDLYSSPQVTNPRRHAPQAWTVGAQRTVPSALKSGSLAAAYSLTPRAVSASSSSSSFGSQPRQRHSRVPRDGRRLGVQELEVLAAHVAAERAPRVELEPRHVVIVWARCACPARGAEGGGGSASLERAGAIVPTGAPCIRPHRVAAAWLF